MKCPRIIPGAGVPRVQLGDLAGGDTFALVEPHDRQAEGSLWLCVAFALGPNDTGAAASLDRGVLVFFPLDALVHRIELAAETSDDDW